MDTIRGLQIGATTMAPLLAVVAGIGIIVEMITVGGLTQDLTFLMLDMSEGSLYILLFLAMLLSILFGMGLPTVAAYVLVALLVGPAVVDFGVEPLFGHMFVFYFAILSAITPPVALACVVASGISGADFLATAREALKVAAPGFVLPYSFIIHSQLLRWDPTTLPIVVMVLLGLFGIVVGLNGYFTRSVRVVTRGVLLAASLAVLLTSYVPVNAAGMVILLGFFGRELLVGRISIKLPGVSRSD